MPEDATAPPGRGCAPMVRAACDAGREGLGAATPITRDQWCAQDPGNADRLASAPDFSLMLSSGGESVVLTWVREGASKRFAVPGDRRESLQRSPRCCRAVRRPEGAKAPGSPASGTDRNVRYAAVRPNRADRTGRNACLVRHLSGFRYGRYAFFTTSPRGCPFARDPGSQLSSDPLRAQHSGHTPGHTPLRIAPPCVMVHSCPTPLNGWSGVTLSERTGSCLGIFSTSSGRS